MTKYHKIDTMFKRDMDNGGKIIYDHWAVPEVEYLKNSIVARPTTELFTRRGDRIIAKIKAKDFR